MSNTPWSPARQSQERVQTWVTSQRKLLASPGHFSAAINTLDQLRTDDALGHSWESFAAEALIMATGERASASFYRDKAQNEIDLVLDFRPAYSALCVVEFKYNPKDGVKNGFWPACEKIQPSHRFLVHPGQDQSDHGNGLISLPLLTAIERIQALA